MPKCRWPSIMAVACVSLCLSTLGLFAVEDGQETTSEDSVPPNAISTVEEEIVVSATLDEVPRSHSGSSVSVISRSELEQRKVVTVAEALRYLPGLEVVQTGGLGGATSVFIRGANSSHTLVLIDGVRANSPMGGAFDWADLTTDRVERIEVLRGPQSALYGSEAIGGVVSIVSRRGGDAQEVQAGLEAGSETSHRLWASAGGGSGEWDWDVSASQQQTDGYSRASEANGNLEEDPWENLSLTGGIGRSLSGDGSILVSARYFDSATGLDGFDFAAGPIDDLAYEQDRELLVTSISADIPVTSRWRQKVRLGYSDETLETQNADPNLSFLNSITDTATGSIELLADVVVTQQDSLTLGAAYEERDAKSRSNFSESVSIVSAFAENRLAWDDAFFVNLSLRLDDHSVYGAETTGRASFSWILPRLESRFHANWGTGFKAPTLVDLYFPFYGNPDLAPERSTSFDLGIEKGFGDGEWLFDLTFFSSEIEDLIVFDLSTFLAGNVAEAEVDGYEVEARWQPGSSFSTTASYTQTDSRDVATGAPLARRPKHRAVVSVNYSPLEQFDAVLSYVDVRDRFGTSGAKIDDYDRVDATLNYRFGERWTTFLRAGNIFDEEYEEVPGYTSPGAEISLGIQIAR